MSRREALDLYLNSGMEVAAHGLHHSYMEQLPENLCTYEILQDRKKLEADYGGIIRGFAYPYGATNDSVVASLKQCGIAYARTGVSKEQFSIPTDWLRMPVTCRHRNPRLMELANAFVNNEFLRGPGLFYLMGHSYEFDWNVPNNNWGVIEEFAEFIGNRENIWYATNIEIYDYIAAYNQLIFSMDYTKVYNPTCTTLYFKTNKGEYCVEPGKTLSYEF